MDGSVADVPAELDRKRAEIDGRRQDLQPRIGPKMLADEDPASRSRP
jgi:hypothetical protein